MLSLRSLSFLNNPPLSPPLASLSNKPINTFISQSMRHGDYDVTFKKGRAHPSSLSSYIVRAAEKDSHKFEVDPDKAREALQELDQQLQSFSEKKISLPKIRASDVKLTKEQLTEEEFSDSYLAYSAIGLVLFTILYNIFFETVIKPAIDIPLVAPSTTAVTEASKDQTSN